MSRYDEIIDLPHHVSETRARMSQADRAAQFSSFAALTGFEDCIEEAARFTNCRLQRSETEMDILNRRLAVLRENAKSRPEISLLYFVPDSKKEGGSYKSRKALLRRVDDASAALIFTDGTAVPLEDVYEIQGDIFDGI